MRPMGKDSSGRAKYSRRHLAHGRVDTSLRAAALGAPVQWSALPDAGVPARSQELRPTSVYLVPQCATGQPRHHLHVFR